MKQNYFSYVSLLVLGMLVVGLTFPAPAQTVTVKMTVNTSTCLDTLRASGIVQVSGESKLGTTPAITWSNTTGIVATNVGGDYWQATFQALPGDTIYYKLVTFFNASTPTFHWSGWEGPINSGVAAATTNRALIVGASDTTLPLQYFNGWENTVDQYGAPFSRKTDTLAVYFRVNMAGETGFNPATQTVAVYGGKPLGTDAWPKIADLTRETNSIMSGSFWSGVAYVRKDSVTPVAWQNFKFVYAGTNWETTGDRSFPFTSNLVNVTGDTTIAWTYFSDKVPSSTPATTVNVTFRVNTSTCLDTLFPRHVVGLGGESKKGVTGLSWSANIKLTNVGGDYWQTTLPVQPGDTVYYSFVTKYDDATFSAINWGWDGPINNGVNTRTNRMLVVGNSDTVLPMQYYNGWTTKVGQYAAPFQHKTDSVAVYFRVNMGGAAGFDLGTGLVDVWGGYPMGAPTWIKIITLSRETNSVNGGSFFSGVAYVPKDSVTAGVTVQNYKFVIQPSTWETTSDRSVAFASQNDTTVFWKYFNNFAPTGAKVTADLLWSLKLQALEDAHMFNRALGDKIAVTGAKGWPPSGFNPLTDFDTTSQMLKMTYDPDLKQWNLVESFTKFPNEVLTYKYYLAWDSTRIDSTSPNFIRGLALSDGWEEPGVTGGADRSYTYTDQTQQIIAGDFGYDTQFFNSLHWKSAIKTPIQVKFTIDMAPATSAATNPNTLFRPGLDTVYIQFDGCLTAITQGKTMWGTDNRLMLTDPDADGQYTGMWNLTPPTLNQFCYRVVYTSPGVAGGIMNGSGSAVRGRRYYQYVHPVQIYADSASWPATYDLAVMPWKLDNLTIEDPPSYVTGVGNGDNGPVRSYALMQNFPNPFNPSTVVTYRVPERAHVKVTIYNVLGQLVSTLVDQEQFAGTHSVTWNASTSRATSGVYFLRMEAGSYTNVKKMVLIK